MKKIIGYKASNMVTAVFVGNSVFFGDDIGKLKIIGISHKITRNLENTLIVKLENGNEILVFSPSEIFYKYIETEKDI